MPKADVRVINLPFAALKLNKHFIRSTGAYRSSGWGSGYLPGEELYCVADQALRFAQEVGQEEILRVRRKLFWRGNLVSRFVVELESGSGVSLPLAWDTCQQIIRTWMTLSTKIPLHSGETEYVLRQAGEPLSSHLLKATTQSIAPDTTWQAAPWWCSCGEPLVLCQYRQGELLDIGSLQQIEFTNINDRSYGGLCPYRFEFEDGDFLRGWFLELYPETDEKSYIQLFVHLTRVHTERECLKQVLGLLQQKLIEPTPRSEYSDKVQTYIEQSINIVVYGKSPYGLPKSETRNILAIAQSFDQLLNEDQWLSLLESISHFRPQLLEKLHREQFGSDQGYPKDLTIEERGNLRDLFIACAAVNNRDKRDAIVGELPPNIAATITRSNNTNTDVLNILRTVRDFPGGLQKLVDAVGLHEGKTLQFGALQKGIKRILPGEIDIP